jgi:hypothetical protein
MATRLIRFATSKPTVVFGAAHPSDTIQRWLERSYTNGHHTAGALWLGSVPIFGGALSMWWFSTRMTGKLPHTLSKEWTEANAVYDREQGSDRDIFAHWKVGTPVPVPTRTVSWLKDSE